MSAWSIVGDLRAAELGHRFSIPSTAGADVRTLINAAVKDVIAAWSATGHGRRGTGGTLRLPRAKHINGLFPARFDDLAAQWRGAPGLWLNFAISGNISCGNLGDQF
jgi:hypothetical protein